MHQLGNGHPRQAMEGLWQDIEDQRALASNEGSVASKRGEGRKRPDDGENLWSLPNRMWDAAPWHQVILSDHLRPAALQYVGQGYRHPTVQDAHPLCIQTFASFPFSRGLVLLLDWC